jgi:hypothetical protein
MPLFGINQAGGTLTSIIPGDSFTLFDAETLTAPQASIAFSRGLSPAAGDNGITFQILFAGAPTAVVKILATNVYQYPGKAFDLSEWVVVYSSTDLQQDAYTDIGRSAFYCAYLASQSAGGALTVLVER